MGLKPNDFGLSDMLGNAFEWIYDTYSYHPSSSEDAVPTPTSKAISDTESRVLRGGSFLVRTLLVRFALRTVNRPLARSYNVGFRPSRTYHLSP